MSFINKIVPVLLLVSSLIAMDYSEFPEARALYAAVCARDVEQTRDAIAALRSTTDDDERCSDVLVRAYRMALDSENAVIAHMLSENWSLMRANSSNRMRDRFDSLRTPSPAPIFGLYFDGSPMNAVLSRYLEFSWWERTDTVDFLIDLFVLNNFNENQLLHIAYYSLNKYYFPMARRLVQREFVRSAQLERVKEGLNREVLNNAGTRWASEKEHYLDILIELAKEVEARGVVRSSVASSSSSSGAGSSGSSSSGGSADGSDADTTK